MKCAVISVEGVQLRVEKQEELSIARKAQLWKTIPDPKIITHLHFPKTQIFKAFQNPQNIFITMHPNQQT